MDYIVETDFTGPNFVMVPNAVAQSGRLSAEALGVLVYLASLPRGFLVRVGCIQSTFQMGKDRWQRIARELREVGAMDVQIVRGPGGRAVGRRVLVRWPDFGGEAETVKDRKPGKPAAGKPAKQGGETRQTGRRNPAPYKDQRLKKGAREKMAAPQGRSAPLPADGQARRGLDRVKVSDLSPFQLSRLHSGQSLLVKGVTVLPGTPEMEALRAQLREAC